jgi:Arc/MetJ-type ribon-helix-helix transcriptional regulator
MFKLIVSCTVYGDLMAQVRLRLPEKMIVEIDCWVSEGRFKNRSDAIKSIITLYEEREKTREFFELLNKRSEQAKKTPEKLVPLL